MDGIWPNFAYALILTRSRLGLLSVNFRKFVRELLPLIDVSIIILVTEFCFRSISWEWIDGIWPILHMHWYWQALGRIVKRQFLQIYNYGPWLMSEFCFRSISWEWIDEIWPNFAYAFILTRFRLGLLGLLRVSFRKFIAELWPLIDVRISIPLSILRKNWWNLTKFCIWHNTQYWWSR